MDSQQPNIPDIRPQVNRLDEKEEDRGKSGILAGLLSRLGLGSGGGSGVLGGLGGAGAGGGLLATKAGIIGLIVVGTTVAGSIGMVGYKLFGPGDSDRLGADYSSIFAAKPKGGAESGGAAADGTSPSLSYLARANAGKSGEEAEAQPSDSPAGATAGAAAAGAGAAAPGSASANDNAPGQGPAAKLKTDRKFGELGKTFGGAGGGAGSAAALAGGAGSAGALLAAAKPGSLGGFSAGAPARAASGRRAIASGRRASGAVRQLSNVYRDQKGAGSSQAAGTTYDGNQAASQIGPEAGAPGAGSGAGTGAGPSPVGANPTGNGNQRFDEPPSSPGANVTPWQAAINSAMLMLVGAAALLLLCSKIADMVKATGGTLAAPMAQKIITVLAGLAAALSLAAIAFGAMISGGKFGQPLQGNIIVAAGSFMAAASAAMVYAIWSVDPSKVTKDTAFSSLVFSDNTTLLMLACGGASMALSAWAYLATPKKYSSDLFRDGRPPDWDHKYEAAQVVEPPSQGVLDRYLA
ncbi:MAG: hypothetical protein PHF00_01250 [Elusimicrobia bacterium]|nr:hypothetical protein [Elusimicrobiota bacterium]